jgi:hypothetical protein
MLPFHFDICVTWLYNSGLGEKFWMRGRPRTTDTSQAASKSRDIPDTKAFQNWQPDQASIQDCDYEVLVIPAGAGILYVIVYFFLWAHLPGLQGFSNPAENMLLSPQTPVAIAMIALVQQPGS